MQRLSYKKQKGKETVKKNNFWREIKKEKVGIN